MDLLGFLTNPSVRDVSAIVVLTGVVVLILTGRLLPIGTHKKIVAAAVERGNEWKATAGDYQEVNRVVRSQNSDLIESNKVMEQLLRASAPPPIGNGGQS